MQMYSKATSNLLSVAFLIITIGSTASLGQGSQTGRERDDFKKVVSDIANFDSETYTESLRKLFAVSPNRFDTILRSVSSSSVDESKGAQILIRYIGDSELFSRMQKVCDSRCFLSGPVPLPLHSLDVRELEYLLNNRDICKLGEFEMKYIYAVYFDDNAPSRALLRRVEEKAVGCASDSLLRSRMSWLRAAHEPHSGFELELSVEVIRANLFFLTPKEREHAKLQFISLNARRNRALYEILVDNGVLATRYFHVIFAKGKKNKWRFYSVTAVSQS